MASTNKKFKYGFIKIDELIEEYREGILQIPRIQRNLVWKKSQKEDLLDSLMNGYPIGIVLFSKINEQKYIIDGLQRTSTIMNIFNNMFEDMKPTTLKKIIDNAIHNVNEEYKKNISKESIKDLIKFISSNIVEKVTLEKPRDSRLFAKQFRDKYAKEIQEIDNDFTLEYTNLIFFEIHRQASEKLGINDYELPYTEFVGTIEETAYLFELINRQGTKLENSDIWKSQWSTIEMNFKDSEITNKINASFNNVIDNSLKLSHEKINSLSPFDIVWFIFHNIFSKNWQHHISIVFSGKMEKSKESNGAITGIASLINLIKIHILLKLDKQEDFDDEKIGEKFQEVISSRKDVDDIIERLCRSIKLFDTIFKSFDFYKGNKKNGDSKAFLPDKSYIIVILGNIYKYLYLNQVSDTEFIQEFKHIFIKHYIFDLISGTFNSSSSKKAFLSIKNNDYLRELSIESLQRKIDDFFDSSITKTTTKSNFDNKSCTLMAYLFIDLLKITEHSDNDFHNDHLIPKSQLINAGIVRGVSSFANLSLITSEKNLNKSGSIKPENLDDDLIYKWSLENDKDMAAELREKHNVVINKLTEETYFDFLKKRKEIISKMFINKK